MHRFIKNNNFQLTLMVIFSLVSLLSVSCKRKNTGDKTTQEGKTTKIDFLNVSYDPTREFYQEINPSFAKQLKENKNIEINIRMSHGGAGKQARSVIAGLEADVVTLALEFDINAIAKKGLMPENWRSLLPHDSAPYTSTIVFLVRDKNPKKILDWDDLAREDVSVITPNPKTSGGSRWNHMAAWAYALKKWDDEEKATTYIQKLYKNVPVLDTGARGSTNTFVERGIGDVFLAWENEALLTTREFAEGKFEIIYPSMSILAEPSVAVVERNCSRKNNCDIANEYLNFLYTEQAQKIAARHHFRPRNEAILNEFKEKFPDLNLLTIDEIAGGWEKAHEKHFVDGGLFDQIFEQDRR